ncbi:sulfatase-like hydrolase/transferase [Haloarcula pelagica]|uniref:sulfatase-like hydrolase/transferase n=1 Tax=Haloarcula pelagica TaxID=3033389 RepID=UPI0024C40F1C|nr:sulfatase-like hydrolase/transferase [Halomicroarcula sp. YJ-61-S]
MEDYRRDTTPAVRSIAEEGRYFQSCFAHGKYTLTSTASILTGTYPTWHRLGYERSRLPEGTKTIPQRFRDVGYATGGFSSNRYVSAETGLDQGFDQFSWIHPSTLLGTVSPRHLVGYALSIRRHSAGLQRDPYKHATPYLLNHAARDWLSETLESSPVFAYLHYNEPHRPYYPPLSYIDAYTDSLAESPRSAGEISMNVHRNVERLIATGTELDDGELAAIRSMYDAEIRYTDQQVGSLLNDVRSMSDRPVVVVVTADHGELFGEYGLMGHKFVLRDELTRVPLAVSGLKLPTDRSSSVVQHADVLRTILATIGADTEGVQGINLETDKRTFAVSQHHRTDLEPYQTYNPEYEMRPFHEGECSSIRTDEFRLVREEGGDERLYALPDEKSDLTADRPETAAALRNTLQTWMEDHTDDTATESDRTYSPAMREQLADLGYIDS